MKVKGLLMASLLLAALMAAMGALALMRLPEGARLITHWAADGTPNGSMPAARALFIAPLMVALLGALFAVLPSIEPLQERMAQSAQVLRVGWISLLILMTLVFAQIAGPAFGIVLPVSLVSFGAGAMLVALGNVLPKSRPGFFVGIRTPWTLTDTENWIATHRLAARLFILAGLAVMLASVLPVPMAVRGGLLVGAALFAALVPTIYSWWFWQSRKGRS
ncbi:SdpI family protein [Novosphingobium sediminicola]|uniref:Putative membrane protein n=1 Tax=Novosphingobium sediminicola TaxID=563162 RepID=A0A7W6CTH8_9SPHN|nr:SdpI family protein [Novosphingobium sediminicola]MBB3957562.1 putative membrane protein [Novosphingobium sediminicola]